ncbi:MAG: exosortase [Alphaproteobacteria bacterium]|nr:exosortase [Alphaproteobacteria bacterium]
MRAAVGLWLSSSAYSHGLLILPVFAFMLWAKRAELRGFSPRPTLWGGAIILAFGGVWVLSTLSGVAEAAQFAIVGMIQGVLLTQLGWRLYGLLLLPFGYLWLLVPSGEFLVPMLQSFTAHAAARLLELVGIDNFLDGLTIEVASGTYLVAPGCAGLNFVLAALATALAYAELVYRTWGRRLAFVLGMVVLAVAGNALRVFLIIAIAHLIDDVGNIADDHILYGWAFFSVLLLGGMALGVRWRQDHGPGKIPPLERSAPRAAILSATAVAAVLVILAPALVWVMWSAEARAAFALPVLSCGVLGKLAADPEWSADVAEVDSLAAIDCGGDGRRIHFVMAALDRPVRRGKLVGVERWVGAGDGWTRIARQVAAESIGGRQVPVQKDLEANGHRRRVIWSLFWTGDGWHRPGWPVALADLKAELAGHRHAVLVMAATSADSGEAAAAEALHDFLSGQSAAFDTLAGRGR